MTTRKTVRGIRDTIPAWHIIGRFGNTDGPAEVISLTELASRLVATGIISSAAAIPLPILLNVDGAAILNADSATIGITQ